MNSPLIVIFTTVFVDLVGFGIVIPLMGLYGKHFGASGVELAILGSIYSLMQFFFNPVWGALSDRYGRRPILLISLFGSTLSYILFATAGHLWVLILSRAIAGIFAANISAAQAFIADVTTPQDRAKGMGLIGAAFGIGFTLGPPLGGISATYGLWVPGTIAASICALNFIVAYFRLPESLKPENRALSLRPYQIIDRQALRHIRRSKELTLYLGVFAAATFAFTNMEQTFSLFFQKRFALETADAGYQTGLILMAAGLFGAFVQGGLIRKLVPRFGEQRLMGWGLALSCVSMAAFPFLPSFEAYFVLMLPLALGSGLFNPSINTLISRAALATEQGTVLGINQGLSALARALGPFFGLLLFEKNSAYPFYLAASLYLFLFLAVRRKSPA